MVAVRALVAALVVVLALGAAVAPAAGTAPAPGGEPQTDDTSQTIVVTQEFRLTPDRPGHIDIRWEFDIPEAVSEVRPQLPPDAENPRTDGFTPSAGRSYEWDSTTERPSLTFTVPVNETRDVRGPEGGDGDFVFVDTGDWAIARNDGVPFGYTYSSDADITVQQRNVTAGPGVAGRAMVFLGAHEAYTRSAHSQRFRLVVPEAADLAPARAEVFDSVTAASDTLRVGDRDPQVLMVAAPTTVAWGVEGLQRGDRDFYVTADERVDTPDNTWLHEYVHTRQRFNLSAETTWLAEATAQYYAAQLTLRQDRVGFREFAGLLRRGTDSRFSEAVLANPATWSTANYHVGALVVGDLDRRIRLATNSSSTVQAVFRRLNERSTATSGREFLRLVRETAGDAVAERARQYTETTDRPAVWSATEHAEAFGPLPASMRYAIDGLAVRGPYRNETVPGPGPVRVVTGESLAVNATVANVGGRAGAYNLTLTRDGRVVDYATGELDPDGTAAVPVAASFGEPGTYTLAVGGARRTVEVRRPATLTVSALAVDRDRVDPGETVTVTATVRNDADRPGRTNLTVARDGTAVERRTLHLNAGGERAVSVRVQVPEGSHRITAGDRSVTVTGGDGETTAGGRGGTGGTGDDATTGGATPGFGVVGVAMAVALAVARTLTLDR
ncbi:MAG: hypothetical protein V5A30_02970 [Haloarculaceae archaeon]